MATPRPGSAVPSRCAFRTPCGSTVEVAITIDDSDCLLEIGNRGSVPDDAELHGRLPDPLAVGGRGLPFIATLADSAAFIPGQPGQVLLRVRKHLGATSPAAPLIRPAGSSS